MSGIIEDENMKKECNNKYWYCDQLERRNEWTFPYPSEHRVEITKQSRNGMQRKDAK